jgi:hypothetical protein
MNAFIPVSTDSCPTNGQRCRVLEQSLSLSGEVDEELLLASIPNLDDSPKWSCKDRCIVPVVMRFLGIDIELGRDINV